MTWTEMGFEAPEDITQAELALLTIWLEQITAERRRAHAKHGATSIEQTGVLEHRRASILTEEAVECARALNDHEHGTIELLDLAGKHMPGADTLDKELIQTGSMAFTWWANRRAQTLPAPPEPTELPQDLYELLRYLADEAQPLDPVYVARRAREALGL